MYQKIKSFLPKAEKLWIGRSRNSHGGTRWFYSWISYDNEKGTVYVHHTLHSEHLPAFFESSSAALWRRNPTHTPALAFLNRPITIRRCKFKTATNCFSSPKSNPFFLFDKMETGYEAINPIQSNPITCFDPKKNPITCPIIIIYYYIYYIALITRRLPLFCFFILFFFICPFLIFSFSFHVYSYQLSLIWTSRIAFWFLENKKNSSYAQLFSWSVFCLCNFSSSLSKMIYLSYTTLLPTNTHEVNQSRFLQIVLKYLLLNF